MQREVRYLVFKLKDVETFLTNTEQRILQLLAQKVTQGRQNIGKYPLTSVVVEHDWPEYEIVWNLIAQRVDGEKNGN